MESLRTTYTGIGARNTPTSILDAMYKAAKVLGSLRWVLRSGAAAGADSAFESGAVAAGGEVEIYLPFPRFRGHTSPLHTVTKKARLHASRYHPNWPILGDVGRDFMGRNSYQILGSDLSTPTRFVLCYTPEGKIVGGTGQALRVAKDYDIPVFNFGNQTLDSINEGIQEIIHETQA